MTIEVNQERFRLWSTNSNFIAEAKRRLTSKRAGTVIFSKLVDMTDCDTQWTFHPDARDMSWPGVTIELCDGRPSDVEREKAKWLADIGRWCPWKANVVAIDEKPPAPADHAESRLTAQPVVLSGAITYDSDTYLNATNLQVADDTTITVRSGATLTIVADSVQWGDNVTIDATGAQGSVQTRRPPGKGSWTSSPRCHGGLAHNCGSASSAHQAYVDAIDDTKAGRNSDRGDRGFTGEIGGRGGQIRLFLAFNSSGANPFKKLAAVGGPGGPGGAGGEGKWLNCGDHGGEHWQLSGPPGAQGATGPDGRIELRVTGTDAGLFVTSANGVAAPRPQTSELLSQTAWDAAAARERASHQVP